MDPNVEVASLLTLQGQGLQPMKDYPNGDPAVVSHFRETLVYQDSRALLGVWTTDDLTFRPPDLGDQEVLQVRATRRAASSSYLRRRSHTSPPPGARNCFRSRHRVMHPRRASPAFTCIGITHEQQAS